MIQISHFFIIQSLQDGERKTGNEVESQMRYAAMKSQPQPQIQLVEVHSKTDFFQVLLNIEGATKDGIKPMLHFEMHGVKEGLQLSDDSLTKWEELKEPIRNINIASKNNLFVGLATCFGAYFLNLYSFTEPCPFYSYIGATQIVWDNEVEISFTNFYKVLIESADFSKAINALRESVTGNTELYNYVSCEGYYNMLVEHWKETFDGDAAKDKYIDEISNVYFKQNPDAIMNRESTTQKIEEIIKSGNIESEFLADMREIFLHRKSPDQIMDRFNK